MGRGIRVFTFMDCNNVQSYVFESVNKLNPHTSEMISTMKYYSVHTEIYGLYDDTVFVYDDGWYDAVFYENFDWSAKFHFLVSNALFSTKTLFDISDTSMYNTSHVELIEFSPELFNRETAYWMTDFFSNIPIK